MSTVLTGAAGEYFVAAELSRRGWAASITPKNADRTDILAQHRETKTLIALQVKCTSSHTQKFAVSAKDETPTDQWNEWFCFVHLEGEQERPRFFLVPRNQVAALIYVDHRHWLSEPGRGGKARNDNDRRDVRIADIGPYEEAWQELLVPTSQVAGHTPEWFEAHLPRFGLPPGHPGIVESPKADAPYGATFIKKGTPEHQAITDKIHRSAR